MSLPFIIRTSTSWFPFPVHVHPTLHLFVVIWVMPIYKYKNLQYSLSLKKLPHLQVICMPLLLLLLLLFISRSLSVTQFHSLLLYNNLGHLNFVPLNYSFNIMTQIQLLSSTAPVPLLLFFFYSPPTVFTYFIKQTVAYDFLSGLN